MKLLKSINNFAGSFNFWNKGSPMQQRGFISRAKSIAATEYATHNYIELVLNNRHKYVDGVMPISASVKLITHLMLNIELQFKKGEQILNKNPIQEAFKLNISTYHNTYNDFMSSIIKNLCFIDGNFYILAIFDENEELISIDVVNSNCLTPEMDGLINKRVIRYTINNFSPIAPSFVLTLDAFTKTYKTQVRLQNGLFANCILFTTEIAFETGNIYQASPLIPIAKYVALNNAALTRGIILNEKGSDGQFLSMPIPSNDVEKQNAAANDLQDKMEGVINTGATVVVPYTNIGEKANKPEIISFGNKYKDYDVHTDIEHSDNSIYQGLGIPATVIKQDARYTGNQLESFKQLYEFKLIPELTKIIHYLEKWILPLLDNGKYAEYSISIDKASIDVFKEVKAKYIQSLTVLTLNEKRVELGYPPLPDGDFVPQVSTNSIKTDSQNL